MARSDDLREIEAALDREPCWRKRIILSSLGVFSEWLRRSLPGVLRRLVAVCAVLLVAGPARAQIDAPARTVLTLANGTQLYGETGQVDKRGVNFKPAGTPRFAVQSWATITVIRTAAADYFPEPGGTLRRVNATADPSGLLPRLIGPNPGTVTDQAGKSLDGTVLVLLPEEVGFCPRGAALSQRIPAGSVESVVVGTDTYRYNPRTSRLEKSTQPAPTRPTSETSVTTPPPNDAVGPPGEKPKTPTNPDGTVTAPPKGDTKTKPNTTGETKSPGTKESDSSNSLLKYTPIGFIVAAIVWVLRGIAYVALGAIVFGVVGALLGLLISPSAAAIGGSVGAAFGAIAGLLAFTDEAKKALKGQPTGTDADET